MWQLRVLDSARSDLDQIAGYIETQSTDPEAGLAFARRILDKCRHLARLSPMLGRPRPELRADIRSFPFGSHVLFMRYVEDRLEIVNVLHGARDIDSVFAAARAREE